MCPSYSVLIRNGDMLCVWCCSNGSKSRKIFLGMSALRVCFSPPACLKRSEANNTGGGKIEVMSASLSLLFSHREAVNLVSLHAHHNRDATTMPQVSELSARCKSSEVTTSWSRSISVFYDSFYTLFGR